ncbi:hypothetical protein D0Z00_003255 [Geotrichum galactomycetum]|uniref:Uncharacterized protein n=1 Tax=Geotrichum galactomycetum TaxID=27317 RepID=A0ACB6V1W6_9ASCO|nr:hypothetical protein D0Z00_003255 [Geotrichum candidum]
MSQALHSTVDSSISSSTEPALNSDDHNQQQKQQQSHRPHQRNPSPSHENAEFDFTSGTSVPTSTAPLSTPAPEIAPATVAAQLQPVLSQPQPQKVNSPPSYSDESIDTSSLKITLLCMNSTRVTLEINQKFIASHGLSAKSPDSITIGQFKQLVYDEWMSSQKQAEGEDTGDHQATLEASSTDTSKNSSNWGRILAENVTPVPVSPLHVRIIYLGKVLVDEYTFEDYSISSTNANNVLHISIKPDISGSKDKSAGGKHNKARRRSQTNNRRSTGSTIQVNDNEDHDDDHSSSRSGCCVIC